jgi:predicted phosphoadenosine phosphosulfate sulfurtransferase
MKIYKNKNVYEESLDRIRYLFDEFPNVIVSISGGKDSTVILHLAKKVAKEKNRLPLKVMWIDQEGEWEGTVDYCKGVMEDKDVEPYWFQMPMVITNNASSTNRYSHCWKEEEKENWIHPQHPLSIKENKYGTERFHKLFKAIIDKEFKNQKACYFSGVRTEETPKRYVSVTASLTYKGITWGKILNTKQEHYTFNPIYDWSYTDVWKCINDNNLKYNRVYDEMYKKGVQIKDMRISNVHHETSIQALLLIQEIEPQTWNKVSKRIGGANTIKHLKNSSFRAPKEYPYMFNSWEEYARHLLEHLVFEEKYKEKLKKIIEKDKKLYTDEKIKRALYREVINTILSNDWDFTKLANFRIRPENGVYRKYKKGLRGLEMLDYPKFLTNEMVEEIKNANK